MLLQFLFFSLLVFLFHLHRVGDAWRLVIIFIIFILYYTCRRPNKASPNFHQFSCGKIKKRNISMNLHQRVRHPLKKLTNVFPPAFCFMQSLLFNKHIQQRIYFISSVICYTIRWWAKVFAFFYIISSRSRDESQMPEFSLQVKCAAEKSWKVK